MNNIKVTYNSYAMIQKLTISLLLLSLGACATLTEDAMTPIAVSFSDGSDGECSFRNKRGSWNMKIPGTVSVRKSDDGLQYDAKTIDGRTAQGVITSEMGAKIIASAVFIDFGITDAITDKHRKYAGSFVIPIKKSLGAATPRSTPQSTVLRKSENDDLRRKLLRQYINKEITRQEYTDLMKRVSED
jgi:hypothetical protein